MKTGSSIAAGRGNVEVVTGNVDADTTSPRTRAEKAGASPGAGRLSRATEGGIRYAGISMIAWLDAVSTSTLSGGPTPTK
jgi:hypothetical protein